MQLRQAQEAASYFEASYRFAQTEEGRAVAARINRETIETNEKIHEREFRRHDAENRVRYIISTLLAVGIEPRSEKEIRPSYTTRVGRFRKVRNPERVIEAPPHYPLIASDGEPVIFGVTLAGQRLVLRRYGGFSPKVYQWDQDFNGCDLVHCSDRYRVALRTAEELEVYARFKGVEIGEWISPTRAARLPHPETLNP